MKIAISANNIVYGSRAVRRYVLNLIKYLPLIDKENEYIALVIGRGKTIYSLPPSPENGNLRYVWRRIPARLLNRLWKHTSLLSLECLLRGNVDIFHAADYFFPPKISAKSIFTVHSLCKLITPQFHDEEGCKRSRQLLQDAADKFDMFIAVSENVKREFVDTFKVPTERVKAIPLGIGEEFRRFEDREVVQKYLKERFGLEKPYLLYLGALGRHKNVEALVDVYKILCEQKQIDHSLVLAGPCESDEYCQMLRKKIAEYNLEAQVVFPGYIRQECDELPLLYNGASLFVFPTFYEGWTSLPLEAMACGTPVATSNVSSLPETVGDAALLFNPYDVEEMAHVIHQGLDDASLRQSLVERGFRRAGMFTWQRMAEKTLRVYKEIGK